MITNQIIFKTFAIALTFITSGTVFANSNSKSIFPTKSQFSKNLNSKIERNLGSTNPTGIIGLNSFEKKNFNHHGIKAGNNFSSIVENIDIIFEKTSADIKITVEKSSSGLIFLRYSDQENLEKKNLNKVTIEDNI